MKRRIKILFLVLIFAMIISASSVGLSAFTASPKGDIDVWLVAGQSNAVGCGDIDGDLNAELDADPEVMSHFTDPRFTNGFDNVLIWNRDTAKDFVPVQIGQGKDSSCVGPEVGIASALADKGGMHAIIKISFGDTNLYPNTYWKERDDGKTPTNYKYGTWTPPSYVEKYLTQNSGYTYDTYAENSDRYDANATITEANRFEGNKIIGNLYSVFISSVTTAVNNLRDQGYNPILRGMWWMQGEADAAFDFAYGQTNTTAENSSAIAKDLYKKLLTCLIEDVRHDLTGIFGYDCSEMPFVLGKLVRKPGTGTLRSMAGVTQAQEEVAQDTSIGFCTMITPSDYSGFAQLDGWHYSAPTQKWIGEQVVKMINSNVKTNYGTVPTDYASESSYPFVIFKDGKFVSAVAKWTEALDAGKNAGDGATILMRADATTNEKYSNLSNIKGTLTVDLGGYQLSPGTSLAQHSKQAIFAADAKPSTANSFVNTTIAVKNGTLLPTTNADNPYSAIINFHTWYNSNNGDPYGDGTKVFNFSFENVTFKATRNNQPLLASVYKTDTGLTEKKATLNLTIKDCNIDVNGKTGVTLINEIHSSNEPLGKINPIIIGGNIKANAEGDITLFKARADSAPSTLKFDRVKGGKYTTITLSGNMPAPEKTYMSVNEGSLSWNTGDPLASGTDKTYFMVASEPGPAIVPELAYINKLPNSGTGPNLLTKVTFGENLAFFALVPRTGVSEVKVNGSAVNMSALDTENVNGVDYFVVKSALVPNNALSDITLAVTSTESGEKIYTLNTVEYASEALASARTDEEKQLIKDALAYIKAAYDYFGKTNAIRIAEINQILGVSYNSANAPEWSEIMFTPTAGNGLTGASIILDAETAIRFYITESADKYNFTSSNRTLKVKAGSDESGNYIDVFLTAAEMNDTIKFTVQGTSYSGSYNLKSYYNYFKSQSGVDYKLIALVERIAAYAESSDIK